MKSNTSLMPSNKFYWGLVGLLIVVSGILSSCQQKSRPSTPTKKSLPIMQDSINLLYGIASERGTILDKKYFIINHNDNWKIPYWVAYKLDSLNLKGKITRQGQFKPESQLAIGSRAELIDYEKSGYDRGHMAPAADFKRSKDAMTATFLLSNMSPQTPELNRKIWQKLEDEVRNKVKTLGKAWIVTGNIFMSADSNFIAPSNFIGFNKVAVPTHCFKVMLFCRKDSAFIMYAFLMPNQKTPILGKTFDYLLSVDRLEQITGYDFFPLLEDSIENRLEKLLPTIWAK